MKQILLAINGNSPTALAFQYAVDLCKRIKAELKVLQFIRKKRVERCLSHPNNTIPSLCVKELQPRSQKAGVPFQISLCAGELEKELPEYIDNHQEIVLTIFDSSSGRQISTPPGKKSLRRIKKNIPVPLVIIRN